MTFTVLGGSGFVGSHVARRLRAEGRDPYVPDRRAELRGRDLGHVIYCIGVTADFRSRPFDTVDAHVAVLTGILRTATVESLVYLSSTRLYRRGSSPASERDLLAADPADPDDLYDLSKSLGEAVALGTGTARVVRLSNVYGNDPRSPNFLASVIRDALDRQHVELQTALDSWKDYVSVNDASDLIVKIATRGSETVYNVASGRNVSHRDLTGRLTELTGCTVSVRRDAPTLEPPLVDVRRIEREFGFRGASVLDELPALVASYRALR